MVDLMNLAKKVVSGFKNDLKQIENPTPEMRKMLNNLAQQQAMAMTAAPQSKLMKLPASALISHEGAPDKGRVEFYKNLIKQGKEIEPLKVILETTRKGVKYGIEDGKHRFQALTELGITKDIPVELLRFWTKK